MNGLVGFLIGIFAVIGAWLLGKTNGTKTTTTKIGGEITIERRKRENAETEMEAVADISKVVQEAVRSDAGTASAISSLKDSVAKAETFEDALSIARAQAERAKLYIGDIK